MVDGGSIYLVSCAAWAANCLTQAKLKPFVASNLK